VNSQSSWKVQYYYSIFRYILNFADLSYVYNEIGCGGYVNGEGVVTSPINNRELTTTVNIGGDENLKDYLADQCLWFIEARHPGGILLLKKDSNQQHKSEHVHNSLVVSDI